MYHYFVETGGDEAFVVDSDSEAAVVTNGDLFLGSAAGFGAGYWMFFHRIGPEEADRLAGAWRINRLGHIASDQ